MIIRYNKYSIHSLRILIIIYIFIVIEQLNVFAPKEIKLDTQNMQQQKMITKQKKCFYINQNFHIELNQIYGGKPWKIIN